MEQLIITENLLRSIGCKNSFGLYKHILDSVRGSFREYLTDSEIKLLNYRHSKKSSDIKPLNSLYYQCLNPEKSESPKKLLHYESIVRMELAKIVVGAECIKTSIIPYLRSNQTSIKFKNKEKLIQALQLFEKGYSYRNFVYNGQLIKVILDGEGYSDSYEDINLLWESLGFPEIYNFSVGKSNRQTTTLMNLQSIKTSIRRIIALEYSYNITLDQLLALSDKDLLNIKGLGKIALDSLKESIHQLGYRFYSEKDLNYVDFGFYLPKKVMNLIDDGSEQNKNISNADLLNEEEIAILECLFNKTTRLVPDTKEIGNLLSISSDEVIEKAAIAISKLKYAKENDEFINKVIPLLNAKFASDQAKKDQIIKELSEQQYHIDLKSFVSFAQHEYLQTEIIRAQEKYDKEVEYSKKLRQEWEEIERFKKFLK